MGVVVFEMIEGAAGICCMVAKDAGGTAMSGEVGVGASMGFESR